MQLETTPNMKTPITIPSYIHKTKFKRSFNDALLHYYIYIWLNNKDEYWAFVVKNTKDYFYCYIAVEENVWKYVKIFHHQVDCIFY